jgi:hypothetical protein
MRGGMRGGLGDLGEAEIEQLHAAFGRDLHVGGLQVAMDDAALVSVLEGLSDLAGVVECMGRRRGTRQGVAFHEFHDQRALFDAVDGGDSGMVEAGENLGFAGEARETVGVIGEEIGEDFDGDFAVQAGIDCAVDRAHATLAELAGDSIVSDGCGGHLTLSVCIVAFWVGGGGGTRFLARLASKPLFPYLEGMHVHLTNPDLQAKLDRWVTETGRGPDELVEDAMAGYFDELAQAREMLNSRYDDLKSGRVKPISGDEMLAHFREKSATAGRTQRAE